MRGQGRDEARLPQPHGYGARALQRGELLHQWFPLQVLHDAVLNKQRGDAALKRIQELPAAPEVLVPPTTRYQRPELALAR